MNRNIIIIDHKGLFLDKTKKESAQNFLIPLQFAKSYVILGWEAGNPEGDVY